MAPLDELAPESRFDSFHQYRGTYKQIGDHKIELLVLVPKDVPTGKRPILVKFHGGGLVTGSAFYPDWFSTYFVPWAHRHGAVLVMPNYRLIPESKGEDILADLAYFWTWFHAGALDKMLADHSANVALDYERLLVSGESAGGYMALHSGMQQPKGEIKAMLVQYPMTNYLRRVRGELFMGLPAPPESVIDEHLAAMKPGDMVSDATPPARTGISFALSAYGRYEDYFGKGKHLWPISAIEDATYLPPTLFIHGTADTAVAVDDSTLFVEKVKKVLPGTEIRLTTVDGQEHGFDQFTKEDETPWLKEGLKWLDERWLA